jgi:hypothetical protein
MRSWTEEYYDIVDHYFWAPDRLGHRSDKERRLKKSSEVLGVLRRIEEPLNHILGIFFALAPSRFVHELFARHAGVTITDELVLLGRGIQKGYGIADVTQPDFAFDGPSTFVTIEAKVGAGKSSLEQVLKYALLHAMIDEKTPRTTRALLYLSEGPPAKLFSRFVDWADLKTRAFEALPSVQKPAFLRMSESEREVLRLSLETMPISHVSYRAFDDLLGEYEARAVDNEANGVEARLYRGLRAELARRDVLGAGMSL